jgi:hypothetical protein
MVELANVPVSRAWFFGVMGQHGKTNPFHLPLFASRDSVLTLQELERRI